ncbi:MAG TPA: NUDIX hydrolase [Candidatus Coprovivens excrementavium]|nr:NUDIX hydrolase [Candidatus Coprovivens excrementavium]
MNQIIKIGIGVIIINNNQVLLGHRTNIAKDTGGIYEPDSWTLPGGKQEYDETTIEAGIREVKEETNLTIKDLKLFYVSDDISTDRHFVTIDFITETYEGELKVMEPSKIDRWEWFNLNDLPSNLYSPSKKCLTEYLKIKGIKLND